MSIYLFIYLAHVCLFTSLQVLYVISSNMWQYTRYCTSVSIYPSISPFLSIYLHIYPNVTIYLSIHPSISPVLSIYLYIYPNIAIYLFIHPSISPFFIYLSVYLSQCNYLFIYPSIHQFHPLFIYLSHRFSLFLKSLINFYKAGSSFKCRNALAFI